MNINKEEKSEKREDEYLVVVEVQISIVEDVAGLDVIAVSPNIGLDNSRKGVEE